MSPANDDQSTVRRTKHAHARHLHSTKSLSIHDYLSDASLDGFFYRTDASLIEQWQLWDDDDQYGSRPRPPASPFGLHEGLYHDDTTQDIQRYLRQMEEEEQEEQQTCSTCPSSDSNTSSESISSHSTSTKSTKVDHTTDQFDRSLANLQVSSFEPTPRLTQFTTPAPIIIEKKIPALPVLNPILPEPRSIPPPHRHRRPKSHLPSYEGNVDYIPSSDPFSIAYQINERGEKITQDGNRLVFMDVVRPTLNNNKPYESNVYSVPRKKLHHRRSTHIPVLDLKSIEEMFEKKGARRRQSIHLDEQTIDPAHSEKRSLTTTDLFRSIDEDRGSVLSSLSTSKKSIQSSPSSAIGHRVSISSRSHRSDKSIPSLIEKKVYPSPPVLTDEQLNRYVSTIYGVAGSIRSSSRSTSHRQVSASSTSSMKSPLVQSPFMSNFRYMQSSINSNLMREYRQGGYY